MSRFKHKTQIHFARLRCLISIIPIQTKLVHTKQGQLMFILLNPHKPYNAKLQYMKYLSLKSKTYNSYKPLNDEKNKKISHNRIPLPLS